MAISLNYRYKVRVRWPFLRRSDSWLMFAGASVNEYKWLRVLHITFL